MCLSGLSVFLFIPHVTETTYCPAVHVFCNSAPAFCSAGPPLPPQEVQVQCGQTPGVLQVRWKPPPLTSSGTSNGASVIGYAVCTKGQKVWLDTVVCISRRLSLLDVICASCVLLPSPGGVIENILARRGILFVLLGESINQRWEVRHLSSVHISDVST